MVMEVVPEEDTGLCADHPYSNNSSGGICAFCLQEKLGKLVSSSFPAAVFPSSSSSSSSPSFRSEIAGGSTDLNPQNPSFADKSRKKHEVLDHHPRRGKLPFVSGNKKKNKEVGFGALDSMSSAFTRSKSFATPRRSTHESFTEEEGEGEDSPHRRGFWSFLYSSKHSSAGKSTTHQGIKDMNLTPATPSSTVGSSSVGGVNRSKEKGFLMVDKDGSPDEASVERKVSRSRSVGCGSKNFSGDFLERLSNGFGDCALRRVESHREGKQQKTESLYKNGQDGIKDRVRCSRIFSGSSSSSSSSYWVTSSVHDSTSVSRKSISMGSISNGRSKTWSWVLASPMRAFTKPTTTTSGKKEASSSKSSTPSLSAIPSLLTVS